MFKSLKIFPKILISCLLIALIPLLGFIYQIYANGDEQKKVVDQSLLQAADLIAVEVDNWVDKNLKNTTFLANLEAFRNMDADNQIPALVAATKNLEWVSLIFVTDTEGNAVSRSDGKKLQNYSDREYFKQVKAGSDFGQQVLIGKLKPVPLHCFAIPVQSDSQQFVGVITQCSTLVSITSYVIGTEVGNTGFALLLDDKNRLIAHGEDRGRLVGSLQDFGAHPALSLGDRQIQTLNYEGEERVFVSRSVGPGWKLIVQQDYAEAYRNYLNGKRNAIILAIITVLVTLLISFLVSMGISTPVKNLTKVVDAYSKGIFVGDIEGQDRKDELGDLSRAIGRMAKTIQIAIDRLRKLKSGR